MRQVTHALLTRPPLSHSLSLSEEINQKCFVRLACVKHAASVHPEPGSNSRIKSLGLVFHRPYRLCAPQFLIWFFQILELSEQHLLSKATPLRGFFSSSIPFRKTTSFPIPLLLFLKYQNCFISSKQSFSLILASPMLICFNFKKQAF